MSFLSRIFKAKPVPTLADKIQNLDQSGADQLAAIARDQQSDDALREAAIDKLSDASLLYSLSTSGNSNTQLAARKRLGGLLESGSLPLNDLRSMCADSTQLTELSAYSSKASAELISQTQDETLLLEWAKSGSTTQLRQAAADRITTKDHLLDLQKSAKNKDKSVYKITKQKLEVFKAEELQLAQIHQEVGALCHQAELLAKRNLDDVFFARKTQIEEQWHQFSNQASSTQSQRYAQAMEKAYGLIAAQEQAEKEKQQAQAAEREAKQDINQQITNYATLLLNLIEAENFEGFETSLKQQREAYAKSIKEAQTQGLNIKHELQLGNSLQANTDQLLLILQNQGPVAEQVSALQSLDLKQGQALKKQISKALDLCCTAPANKKAAGIVKIQNEIAAWSKSVREKEDRNKQAIIECQELIRKGNWSVQQGLVGRCKAIFKDLEQKYSQIEDAPNNLQTKYEDLKAAIERLGDWHEFAVNPKKDALISEMQALDGSKLSPPDLANKIQDLQQQWKELSKGGQNPDEEQWQQFQEAAQKAYEPCKAYFETQAQEREQNRQHRETLLQQLSDFNNAYDWSNADWKDVEKTLRVSRDAWQSYWPIPRKDIKPLQERFDAIMDALHTQLNSEYERNKNKKTAVVEQAEKLIDLENTAEATETAKQLQKQWQQIGQCKRKDDQVLWKRFRSACDAIFERRSNEHEASKIERNEALAKAEDAITQIESLLALRGDEFFAQKSQLEEFVQAYQAAGELPKEKFKSVQQRYYKALDGIEAKTEYERRHAQLSSWRDVMNLAQALTTAESSAEPTAELSSIEEKMLEMSKWPTGTKEAIEVRLDQLRSMTANEPSDTSADHSSAHQLKLLCIRSEIAQGKESPASDRDMRMEFQVAQLQQGLGTQAFEQDNKLANLVLEWLSVKKVEPSTYLPLAERFCELWDLN